MAVERRTTKMTTQIDEKARFNSAILNDSYQLNSTIPYTWVFRWSNEKEFKLNVSDDTVSAAKVANTFDKSEVQIPKASYREQGLYNCLSPCGRE